MIEYCPVQTNQMPAGEKSLQRIWSAAWPLLFFFTPWFARGVRRFFCRLAGARLASSVSISRHTRIDYPWRLNMGAKSSLADGVWAYCIERVTIGRNCCVGEGVRLLTGSHDITSCSFNLETKSITIHDNVWVATGAIILPGITVGEGAVVAAGAVVTKDVEPWTVVGGNPAKVIKRRELRA